MKMDAILVPLKPFSVAKERLRQAGTVGVTALAEQLAIAVLENCAPRHVVVLSESDEITSFAQLRGIEVWQSEAIDLNDAVQRAYARSAQRFNRLFIVHGDLRSPAGLGRFRPDPGITIMTDHRRTGTNVLIVPTGVDFHFAYGADSASLHQREAERLGLPFTVITTSPWRFDIDEPSDLVSGL